MTRTYCALGLVHTLILFLSISLSVCVSLSACLSLSLVSFFLQNGNTALAIARRLGYISVVDTLRVVTEEIITTTTVSCTLVPAQSKPLELSYCHQLQHDRT